MKGNYLLIVSAVILMVLVLSSWKGGDTYDLDDLRARYSSGDYAQWPKPVLAPEVDPQTFEDIGQLPKPTFPADNPFSKEKVKLGKLLFFDPRLSKSGQIACASCHDPELAWADGRRRSYGHDRQTGSRNSMTLLNVAFAKELFWDGRAANLEAQALGPIQDPLEMNEDHAVAVNKIGALSGYRPYFEAAFGDTAVNLLRIQQALATFERTIRSPKSRFDLFIGGRSNKLTDSELLGLHIYRTKAGCINCHNTPYFSDNQYHNDGQTLWGSKAEDLGRYQVTGDKEDIGKFKTPTLREVTKTGPWMHHGNFPTMRDVVIYYNLGNPAPIQKKYLGTARDSLLPTTSPILKELHLDNTELQALEDFLATLSTTPRRVAPPKLPN